MLKPEKRRTTACVKQRRKRESATSEYDTYAKCKCSYRAVGMLGEKLIRKSLTISNYETALERIRQWEGNGPLELKSSRGPLKVADAVKGYLEDANARNLRYAHQP